MNAAHSLTTAPLTGDMLVEILTKVIAQARTKYPAATPLSDEQAAEMACGLRTLAEAIEKKAAGATADGSATDGSATDGFEVPSGATLTATNEEIQASREAEAAAQAAAEKWAQEKAVVAKSPHRNWASSGGGSLEAPLRSGAVALLDAQYIVKMAAEGRAIQPRQLLPPEAFVRLDELMAENAVTFGLRLLCASYPWLQVRLRPLSCYSRALQCC